MAKVAYLVIREGTKWSDVYRLIPGRTVTIGRSPTNQIVIREEQASRQHAEIFQSNNSWVVRDLDSRNGTAIDNQRLSGDRPLKSGDVIWIAKTQLAFVDDLKDAYSGVSNSPPPAVQREETVQGLELADEPTVATLSNEPTNITARRGQAKLPPPRKWERRPQCCAVWDLSWPTNRP